jgi:hypothetical protein
MSTDQNEFIQRQSLPPNSIRPILNKYERQALGILQKVTSRLGMNVVPKLRIGDVLPLDTNAVREDLQTFAQQASFDFTIAAEKAPILAIEFDGPDYAEESCIIRNQKKQEICDQLELPLLRVDTQYLRKIATFTTLELVIEEILTKFTSEIWRSSSEYFKLQTETIKDQNVEAPYLEHLRSNCANMFMGRRLGITTASNLISKIAAVELVSNTGKLFLTKRMARSKDNFVTAVALAVIDEDTAILGVGSVFANPRVPIDAIELADALSVIDVLDQIRMFDESRYAGIEMRHALEFLAHFKEYTADEAGSRFLSLNPMCKPLTGQWFKSG